MLAETMAHAWAKGSPGAVDLEAAAAANDMSESQCVVDENSESDELSTWRFFPPASIAESQ